MPYDLKIRGWMPEHELKILELWAAELPPQATVVEVGSFYGRSAYCLAATAPTATVHCFDQWVEEVELENELFPLELRLKEGFPLPGEVNTLRNFLSNVCGLNNIRYQQVTSPEQIIWSPSAEVDLFFLDAMHTNPSDWEYLEFWLPKMRTGGYISGHDLQVDRQWPAVHENVERLEQLMGKKVETFHHLGSSLWRIKNEGRFHRSR